MDRRAGRTWEWRTALCAVAMVLAAAPARAQRTMGILDTTVPTLHAGDKVKVTVWRAPDLSGEFIVAPDGMLEHPAFVDLYVIGVPMPRVRAMLDSAVRTENVNARAVIQPEFRVAITGAIMKPDLYYLPAGTPIIEAVAQAGGPTPAGEPGHLELIRNGQRAVFDLTDASGPASRVTVESGDQLVMAQRSDALRSSLMPLASVLSALAGVYLVAAHRR